MVLVAYDVRTDTSEGAKRLRRIAKICENCGQRVQNSVFECLVDPSEWVVLRGRLVATMEQGEDSLRFYFLGKHWRRRLEHVGAKPTYDPEGPLVV